MSISLICLRLFLTKASPEYNSALYNSASSYTHSWYTAQPKSFLELQFYLLLVTIFAFIFGVSVWLLRVGPFGLTAGEGGATAGRDSPAGRSAHSLCSAGSLQARCPGLVCRNISDIVFTGHFN